MDILYLAHRIPFPPNKGDKLRSFRQLEHLAKHYRVWCACFVDDPSDQKYVGLLSAYCHNLVAIRLHRTPATLHGVGGLLRGRTITESFYSHPRMTLALRRWSELVKFDAVVAFSSSMARYALQVPADRKVLDLCDLDSAKWLDYAAASSAAMRRVYAAEGNRLAAREHDWLRAFDTTILITKAEAALLGDAIPPGKLQIVGNGVTLPELATGSGGASGSVASSAIVAYSADETRPPSSGRNEIPIYREPARRLAQAEAYGSVEPIVGFLGTMDYRPNADAVCWFVEKCWKGIRASHPECTFRIVGRSPTRRVRQLARVPGVEVVGEVTNVVAELQRFTVNVAPMQIARGLQNKVLEAMAAARPIVLSNKASEGIAGSHNQEYVIADGPEETVAAVVRLLNDERARERIGHAARRHVAAHHCWECELQKFELIVVGQIGPMSMPVAEAVPTAAAKPSEFAKTPRA